MVNSCMCMCVCECVCVQVCECVHVCRTWAWVSGGDEGLQLEEGGIGRCSLHLAWVHTTLSASGRAVSAPTGQPLSPGPGFPPHEAPGLHREPGPGPKGASLACCPAGPQGEMARFTGESQGRIPAPAVASTACQHTGWGGYTDRVQRVCGCVCGGRAKRANSRKWRTRMQGMQ